MAEGIIDRELLEKVLSNLDAKEAIAIRGPRQSGKSTLLKILKDRIVASGIEEDRVTYLSFEDPNILDEFTKDPRGYISTFIRGDKRHYFLLDEVQYDKQAGRRLKLIYDSMPNVKLIITGSSTLDVSNISTSLVGRVFLYELLPLSFGEYLKYKDYRLYGIFIENHRKFTDLILKDKDVKFNGVSVGELERHLEQYVCYGGFPEVVKSREVSRKVEVLKNIYITYLEKDIPGVFGITDVYILRKTILYLALNIGNILDYNSIASDTGLYYSKLMKYLGILGDTYVVRTIPPFYRNRITELKKNKKLYFFDTGLRNYIIQNFNPLDKRDDAGRLFENFAASELHQIAAPTHNINYWRTTAKAEVDFIFNRQTSIIPIEIKHRNVKKPTIEKSMQSFITAYAPKSAIIAGRGILKYTQLGKTRVYFPSISYL